MTLPLNPRAKTAYFEWLNIPTAVPNNDARQAAEKHQATLAKPLGALGRLEDVVIRLAALQGTWQPVVDHVHITVFTSDHGVVAEDAATCHRVDTAEMLKSFVLGRTAVAIAARMIGAALEVINLGTVNDPGPIDDVKNCYLGAGTANFAQKAAMNEQQLAKALHVGRHAAERARLAGAHLFIGGGMGAAGTTAATALACSLLDATPAQFAGSNDNVGGKYTAHNAHVIQRALDLHKNHITSPLESLRHVGGFEIAALVGAYIACAHMGLPVLVDGFISSAAALAAARLRPGTEDWLLFSHTSNEKGHHAILDALGAQPLLNVGWRLDDGCGAATAVPLLRMACAVQMIPRFSSRPRRETG